MIRIRSDTFHRIRLVYVYEHRHRQNKVNENQGKKVQLKQLNREIAHSQGICSILQKSKRQRNPKEDNRREDVRLRVPKRFRDRKNSSFNKLRMP
ncbi:unnamed protein product (macronuclear) [Paramecium tetraurelia]|uniref:Uncharacterized protein n=1 Tax=Paramecium tetraurelia TaxID=5888 RepID=A0CQW7_PARTE|nr:uncharacterized protein GSPATT00009533001 [Paramecium tetraurelia]CAK73184.1 unnamed protein product [Paramecium tetraurelia]|eukprot:XP_001440581.1 hypothetical protein (macronuclear) [Paramecium tetraurelia strain d4-2]